MRILEAPAPPQRRTVRPTSAFASGPHAAPTLARGTLSPRGTKLLLPGMPPNTTAASAEATACLHKSAAASAASSSADAASPPTPLAAPLVTLAERNAQAEVLHDAAATPNPNAAAVPAGPTAAAAEPLWKDKYNYTGYETIWINAISIILFHIVSTVLFIIAYPTSMWPTRFWATFLGIAGGFGVTGGAHRFWTHRSYKAKIPLRIILMLCFSLSGQNSIYDWVRDHRVHHKFSETDADPHNVKRGFFFAHVGWLMKRKHPEVRRRGQQVDMSDILRDPVAAFQIKYHGPLKILTCFLLPVAVPVYGWNEELFQATALAVLMRYMLNLNFTWLVNSAAHMFGNKPYDRRIAPVENKAVSVVALGEGWHNYHHVFPWDYKAAELAHINLTLRIINWFARIGWAYDLKTAPASLIRRVAERYGDGTHPQWGTASPEIPEEAAHDPSILDSLPAPAPAEGKDKSA